MRDLTVGEAAKLSGFSPSLVRKFMDDRGLRGYRIPGGHRRVPAKELLRFLEASGVPVSNELRRVVQCGEAS